MLLKTKKLMKAFGGLKAIDKVDFELPKNEIRGIIGPNVSGISTFFNLVSGVYDPDPGSYVEFDGHDITNEPAHKIGALGLARTFQLLRLYQDMSVLNNVMSGYHTLVPYKFIDAVTGRKKIWDQEKKIKEEMMDLLSFVGLADYAEMNASELSGGQRRLLVLARAIAGKPKLLMLDEPAAGLSPVNVENLMKILMKLKDKYGLTLIIIEHILKVVMDTCSKVTVLDHGVKIAEGTPSHIKDDNAVIEAYLGKKMDDEEMRKALAV